MSENGGPKLNECPLVYVDATDTYVQVDLRFTEADRAFLRRMRIKAD